MHSNAGPVVNDWWEKTPLTMEDLKKIKSFLDRIKILKQQGLTGFGIVTSYLRCWVQPLKARETYDFEYAGAKDSSQMIPMQELIEEEILERLRKILKGVNVIPHQVNKFSATNPPPVVSVIYLK
jgi:hypothetical protein